MIIYARELVKNGEPLSFITDNGRWADEDMILSWVTEHFGEYGERWTYYYLIEYFEYSDMDYPFMTAMAADVALEFYYDEDAFYFKMVWG